MYTLAKYHRFFVLSMEQMSTLEQFIERLIEEKGLVHLEPEVLAEVREDLMTRVNERLNAEMVAALPEGKVDELNVLIDKDDEGAIRDFFMTNVPNVQDVFARTLMDFRSAYLG